MSQEQVNSLCDKNKMIYCIDIDGTLFTYPEMKPNKKLIDYLKERHKKGHYILLFTGRASKFKEETMKLLNNGEVPYNEVVFDKPKAHIYIDDNTVDIEDYMKDMKGYDKKFQEIGNNINKHIRQGNGI